MGCGGHNKILLPELYTKLALREEILSGILFSRLMTNECFVSLVLIDEFPWGHEVF